MRICTIVGARPQFIKAAVVSRALVQVGVDEVLIHTGQHYDDPMSRIFFEELEIPEPAVNLNVGSGTHAVQTGAMMTHLEACLTEQPAPAWVLVYGDTNSTLAGALVAAKLHLPLAHVEAGLRSFNRRMPEEINRVVTDRLSQQLFCPSRTAVANLQAEGVTEGVHLTGDVMYDALLRYGEQARRRYPLRELIPFEAGTYYLATAHRAENTDDPARLRRLLDLLGRLDRPVVWPLHPRTQDRLKRFGMGLPENVHVLPPASYLVMLSLLAGARRVLTDSGGLQKEAYWMERPCVTLRAETEWVETLEGGWNAVVDLDADAAQAALASEPRVPVRHPYGDGRAAEQIARLLAASGGEAERAGAA